METALSNGIDDMQPPNRQAANLDFFWSEEVLGTVPFAEDNDGLPANLEEDAMDVPAFPVEELARQRRKPMPLFLFLFSFALVAPLRETL